MLWRLRRGMAAQWACLIWPALVGCGPGPATTSQDPVLGSVRDYPIHRSVVDQIALEQKLEPQQALDFAADTLRLYFAHLEEPNTLPLSASLEHYLRNKAAVRLWLRNDFQAQATADTVPAKMLDEALEKASTRGDPFRPRLHGICQVVVKPAGSDKKDARQIPNFEREARRAIAPLYQALLLARADLKKNSNCTLFNTMASALTQDPPTGLSFKPESMVIDLSGSNWDRDFVQELKPAHPQQLLAPFMTQFGMHLVYLTRVYEPHLPAATDGSIPAATQAKRRAHMRKLLQDRWRQAALDQTLNELRKRQTIEIEAAAP